MQPRAFTWRDSMHEPRQSHIAETCRVLLVPGIGNSGPTHWQSYWEAAHASYARVHQRDWDHPVCADWVAALECAAQRAAPNPLLVAHSLGCLTAVHWLAQTSINVTGVLLVAIPDPDRASFPAQAKGFAPIPGNQLPCPSIVVASADDPYSDIAFAQRCANAWKSRFIDIGCAGHINAASGLGNWEQGHRMLRSLLAGS